MEEDTGIEPVEAAEETESAPVETEEQDGTEPAAEPPKAKGVQKRIDELVKQREDERRRAERLEQMLHEMYTRQEKPAQQEEPRVSAKPTREQFDFDDDKYIDALTDWKLEQVEVKRQSERQQREWEDGQRKQIQTFEEKRTATVDQGRTKFTDFDDVVFTLPPNVLTAEFAAAIFETENPAEVAYYLGKNREEAARLAALPALRKAVELGRIEAKLSAPKTPKISAAPAPIAPVGSKSGAGFEPDAAKDPEGWLAWERARVKAAGRRF